MCAYSLGALIFLSTPSARRATASRDVQSRNLVISIHALREEGDKRKDWATRMELISIHALREEGDSRPSTETEGPKYFYPRPPRGGRPERNFKIALTDEISIHALREEGDAPVVARALRPADFYPRPPRGGRPTISS